MSEPTLPPTTAPAETQAQIPVTTQTQATQITPATPAQEKMSEIRQTEAERTTFGQRRVNLIWEATQSLIALSVTITTLYVAAVLVTRGETDSAAFLLLSNAFFLVIGFYFGRTNHQRVGGVGGDSTGSGGGRDLGR